MAVAGWRPDLAVQVAFNANPNDATAVPTWTDLTTLLRTADALTRGRQYELDQNQGSQPSLVFLDKDEYLNPTNPLSPYSPNVLPYRQILCQAMWPNGGTGNLLNTGYGTNPQLATTAGYDPSFESYTTGATVAWIAAVGATSPVIGTTTPHAGTKDLTWTVASSSTVQGVKLVIPCIPGRQYTASGYIRQSSASTQQIQVLNPSGSTLATGTSTTSTGAYVRLSVTFTAAQPTQTLRFATTGTAVAGTVLLDDIQHEPGSSASTFTTSGPVIYGLFRGYVERWPSAWDHAGFLGRAEVTCVDAFAALNLISLDTEYRNAVLAKDPYYTWFLAEPQGATSFAESSGNTGPSLIPVVSKYGPGTDIAAGTQIAIAGDPNTSGVKFTPTAPQNGLSNTGTIVGAGTSTGTAFSFPATAPTTSLTATLAVWVQLSTATAPNTIQQIVKIVTFTQAGGAQQAIGLVMLASGAAQAELWGSAGGSVLINGGTLNDNKPHLVIGTWSLASAGNTTVTLYIDGTQVATSTVATSTIGMVNLALGQLTVGGQFNLSTVTQEQQGTIAHVALWNRVLSASEIADLVNAGKGYSGETSGTRITRYLAQGWTGLTSIDAGQSVMGASALSLGTMVLAACQDVTATENGNFWVDADGNTTFAARTRRYLATTSQYTFGENSAGGEFPYEGDISFDFDPTLVYGVVEIDNADGFTATAVNAASELGYFPRAYQRNVNVLHDSEATDAANYLLNQHAQPHQRVSAITLDPAGTPALWPVVLGIEVGTRVTARRRAKAANTGAGLTLSGDFFVEQISHGGIDMEAGTWTTTLYLSPVDLMQVGLFDDTTFGRLATGGASLHSSITASATSASVDLTGGDLFTTTGTPFTATIGSEVVTVTAVSGASSPQTLTITRPTDGTASAHSAGAAVQVDNPFVLAY